MSELQIEKQAARIKELKAAAQDAYNSILYSKHSVYDDHASCEAALNDARAAYDIAWDAYEAELKEQERET